eukprot:TRINITY_DN38199_c0_g1_i1.p1 TRINITY_DN38199_c0_g1~~TRINITY_DN38199_c0_g1_i1.p1  ORF type:complete len:337 (-),score=30.89 TRINITY_DN38199_c0_g1_i1:243-1112(-)
MKKKLMLPDGAVPGIGAAFGVAGAQQLVTSALPSPTPSGMPIVTPVNAHSTEWRTQQCPFAPLRRDTRSGSFSIPTPAALWPNSAASTPMCSPTVPPSSLFAGDRFAWGTSGIAAQVAMPSPGGSDMETPNNVATTTWRRIECPDAPLRQNVPRKMSWDGTPLANPLPRKQSVDGMPFSNPWAAARPSAVGICDLDRFWPSPGATPVNSALNTAFIGTPMSTGGASPSPFGIETPIATVQGEATPSLFGIVSQMQPAKTEFGMDVDSSSSEASSPEGSNVTEWIQRMGA